MKRNLMLVGGLLAVLLSAAAITAISSGKGGLNAPAAENSASSTVSAPTAIKSFTVENHKFVAKGDNLSKVEIWAVPAGKDAASADYSLIGTAVKTSGAGIGETWTLAIPSSPITASQIFARGYDMNGSVVAKMPLPYSGVTEIRNALSK